MLSRQAVAAAQPRGSLAGGRERRAELGRAGGRRRRSCHPLHRRETKPLSQGLAGGWRGVFEHIGIILLVSHL